jgi:hypothetical protein
MTTAKNSGIVKEDGVAPATPFDTGSGRVDLSKAGNPGLTFDETAANYLALAGQLWNANYPSLYIPIMPGRITVQRTVHNELDEKVTWRVDVTAPKDVTVIAPKKLQLDPGASQTFEITIDAEAAPHSKRRFSTTSTGSVTGPTSIPQGRSDEADARDGRAIATRSIARRSRACDPGVWSTRATVRGVWR